MKKLKKVFAVLLSVVMILGMSSTVFAVDHVNESANGSSNDSVDVSIEKITGSPNVTLYQIAKGVYQGTGQNAFVKYEWAPGITPQIKEAAEKGELTADQVTTIVNGINAAAGATSKITPFKKANGDALGLVENKGITDGTYTAKVNAGAYIALITGANDGTIYNPILLTASYNAQGQFVGGNIDADSAMYGNTAFAKKTKAGFDKEVTGTEDDNGKATASVGDTLHYTLDNIVVPSYPKEANKKLFTITDKMSDGLTFDFTSVKLYFKTGEKDNDGKEMLEEANRGTNNVFTYKGKEVATLTAYVPEGKTNPTGYILKFNYDNLVIDAQAGTTYTPVVKYDAVLNEAAIVGGNGNINEADLYYSNNPNTDSDWEPNEPGKEPPTGSGVDKIHKEKVVYTYKLAIYKVGEGNNATKLPGAIFGIYTDEACSDSSLIDTVTTGENGYAVSTKVRVGDYFVKEIQAPEGYSLNDKVYKVTAKWDTLTKWTEEFVTTTSYTPDPQPAPFDKPVGWFEGTGSDAVFHLGAAPDGATLAYIDSTKTKYDSSVVNEKNDEADIPTAYNLYEKDGENWNPVADTKIPNTKLGALPSTGGIGTIIFTVGGCLIMVVAAALYFANRRRSANSESK